MDTPVEVSSPSMGLGGTEDDGPFIPSSAGVAAAASASASEAQSSSSGSPDDAPSSAAAAYASVAGVEVKSTAQGEDATAAPSTGPTASLVGRVGRPFVVGNDIKTKYPVGKIEMGEPELRGTALMKHHVYRVSCRNVTTEPVYRRFSDFVWLRGALERGFPGLFIPLLPPKRVFGNKDDNFVAERKGDLEKWLNRVAGFQALAESTPFSLFLSGGKGFDEGCKAYDKAIAARDAQEVLEQYEYLFPAVIAKPLPEGAELEIAGLREFLTLTEHKLQGLAETSHQLSDYVQGQVLEMSKMNAYFQQLYDTEKGYPGLPEPPRVDLMEQLTQWHVSTKHSAHSYGTELAAALKTELEDVQATLELLKRRSEQKAKAEKAAQKAKKWETAPPPAKEKDQKQKQDDLETERKENLIVTIMTKLLLHSQYRMTHAEKMKEFRRAIGAFAQQQVTFHTQLLHLFQNTARVAAGEDDDEKSDF